MIGDDDAYQVRLKLIGLKDCLATFGPGVIDIKGICAQAPLGNDNATICHGDSGGPLVSFPKSVPVQIGVNGESLTSASVAAPKNSCFSPDIFLKLGYSTYFRWAKRTIATSGFGTSLIKDGGFEEGVCAAAFCNYSLGAAVGGWHVTSGQVDIMRAPWSPADGEQSIDLDGYTAGAITQEISTQPGRGYRITYFLAGNPDGGVKTLDVRWAEDVVHSASFDTAGQTQSTMGWIQKSVTVTATSSLTKLSFVSTTPGDHGAAIDKVAVVAL